MSAGSQISLRNQSQFASGTVQKIKQEVMSDSFDSALTHYHHQSTEFQSLEVLCESGVTLAKNFERLLSPGPGALGACSSAGTTIDSDMLTQSVATWELAHKVATADSNGLISELLPLLQETVQSVMKDPATFNSSNTYEVFRSCFSAFFQIQWRFCQLYISCASSHGSFLRSPDAHLARSPTLNSFSSSSISGDRRESTESCFSTFSLPRSSFSGVSSLSSRSSSPGPGGLHLHPFGRSRTSSPSVKFTPSQPPSPLMPYGEGSYQPYLFRRWSAHTHTYSNTGSISSGSGHSAAAATTFSSMGGYGSGGSGIGVSSHTTGLTPYSFNRRWSVPASVSQQAGSTTDSGRRTEPSDIDYGLLDAINLLSTKPPTPTNLRDIPLEESRGEYGQEEDEEPQTTSLWPPSETMPGVVLTTCGSDPEAMMSLDTLQQLSSHQSLRVPYSSAMSQPLSQQSDPLGIPITRGSSNIQTTTQSQLSTGEYTLFGNPASNPAHGAS